MTGNLPISRGWRLVGEEEKRSVSFLPGAERLSDFGGLLSLPEEGRPFPLPGMLPEAKELRLSREIPFGSLACDFALLRFSCLRGRGTVLLDGSEIARFSDGPLSLVLTDAARKRRKAILTLAFDETRPAGVSGTVFLRCAKTAMLTGLSLRSGRSRLQGQARVTGEAGKYCLLIRARKAAKPTGKDEAGAAERIRETAEPEASYSFSLSEGIETPVPFSLPLPGSTPEALVLFSLVRMTEHGSAFPCDQLVRFAGKHERPRAWLPLSQEETLENPVRLAEKLTALRIPAISLPTPAEDALAAALSRAGIAIVSTDPENSAGIEEANSLLPEEWAFGKTTGELVRQLCGFTACPVTPSPLPLSEEEMLRAAFGCAPEDPEALREPILRMLVRLRAEGARRYLYSGPIAPRGALSDPALSEILAGAAGPHAAALPLSGGWWCGSVFSCRLFLTQAAPGSRGEASLRDEEGLVLARVSWRDGEMPVLTAQLPNTPSRLSLCLSMILPEGPPVSAPELAIFVGRRGPLEAMAEGFENSSPSAG